MTHKVTSESKYVGGEKFKLWTSEQKHKLSRQRYSYNILLSRSFIYTLFQDNLTAAVRSHFMGLWLFLGFKTTLQLFYCEAPELFCGLRHFTWLYVIRRRRGWWVYILGELFL